jgi:hypothetical protein
MMTHSIAYSLGWPMDNAVPRHAGSAAFRPWPSARAAAVLALMVSTMMLALFCMTAVGAQAGDEANLERNVKAAFLYKFLGYVDYPENATPAAGEPLVIGVVGADGVAEELSRISVGRNMNGRPVSVRKLRAGDAPGKVHMLFIGEDNVADTERALAAVRQTPVLTVTETVRNLRNDSVINFRVVDERVRFEVSLEAAERNNLKLSSRLLAVAYKVQRGSR